MQAESLKVPFQQESCWHFKTHATKCHVPLQNLLPLITEDTSLSPAPFCYSSHTKILDLSEHLF